MIQTEALFKLACEASEAGVAHIFEKIGFDPTAEPLDTEKADASFAAISAMASVLVGKLVANMEPKEVPDVCNHIISQALGMVQASQQALERREKQQKSPIILPKGHTDA